MAAKFEGSDEPGLDGVTAMVESALEHCRFLDDLGFSRYVVSMKDSDPRKVVEGNRRFASARPDVPLHLGVTEAGMLPTARSRRASPSSNSSRRASGTPSASP
jgi:(E)-4-hydroxy-3-methylbut-2-enyl-diphosphate synthase